MSKVYGLTGGIATGKSTVAALLRQRGATVIDADEIARDVVRPGSAGHAAMLQRFGERLRLPNDQIDRAALASMVFGDSAARRDLEAITHPMIAAASAAAITRALTNTPGHVFYDAALLVESGTHRDFAGLVVVACEPATQLARLIRRDQIDREKAKARIAAQLPIADKIAVADWVIDNEGPPDALPTQIDRLLAQLDPET